MTLLFSIYMHADWRACGAAWAIRRVVAGGHSRRLQGVPCEPRITITLNSWYRGVLGSGFVEDMDFGAKRF